MFFRRLLLFPLVLGLLSQHLSLELEAVVMCDADGLAFGCDGRHRCDLLVLPKSEVQD